MGVFGDWAEKYFDLGINVIPIVENKKPPKGVSFECWLKERQSLIEIEALVDQYGHCPGIAVICGTVSGICGFDFDYKFDAERCQITKAKWEKDRKALEMDIKTQLPPSPLIKTGAVGWTNFYKMNPSLRTIQPDRNGIRLFDFKASGYIVVPPSFHSFDNGKQIYYKWILGDPLDEFNDLPVIDQSIVDEMAFWYSSEKNKLKQMESHRHGRLFLYASSLTKIEKDNRKIAEELLKKDLEIHSNDPKGPYFKDRNHVSSNSIQFAEDWIKRIRARNGDKKIIATSTSESLNDAFDYFFSNCLKYGMPRKDILSRKIFYKHPTEKRWAEGSELFAGIKCHAITAGFKPVEVKDHFERFEIEKPDVQFLTDIPAHDGADHLRDHVAALKSEIFNEDELYEIFLQWGNNLFSRIYNPQKQNRCIIIKGNQGIGKDDWIKAMVMDFDHYYVEMSVNRDPIEMISAVQKTFICHLSEFDQTKKLDVAFLKALITNATHHYREKYARVASKKPMHASFICSVNIDHMLRDPTGNRRFIVLPVTAVDWSYKRPGLKILAQFKDAYERKLGVNLKESTEAKISAIVSNLTPDNIDDEIDDLLIDRLVALKKNNPTGKIKSTDFAPVVYDVAKSFMVSVHRVYAIAKKYKIKSGNARFYDVKYN